MQIQPNALNRVKSAPLRAENLAVIFEQLAAGVEAFGAAMSQVTLDYQSPDAPVAEDDLIPVITLALRPATPEQT